VAQFSTGLGGLEAPALKVVRGDLIVQSNGVVPGYRLELPMLTSVAGTIKVAFNSGEMTVVLNSLTSVNNLFIHANAAGGVAFDLPALESVRGEINMVENEGAVTLTADALTSVGTSAPLTIEGNAAIVKGSLKGLTALAAGLSATSNLGGLALELDSLATCGPITLSGNAALSSISAPLLATATQFTASANAGSLHLSLGSLSAITGALVLAGNALLLNSQADDQFFPALRSAGSIFVTGNRALSRLSLPLLSNITDGGVEVQGIMAPGVFSAPSLAFVATSLSIEATRQVEVCPSKMFIQQRPCGFPNDIICSICQKDPASPPTCKVECPAR
jgi:hypothetical protein